MAKQVQKPIEFITPPNVLRAKLATKTAPVSNPLAAANRALADMSSECTKWVDEEIDRLHERRQAFVAKPKDSDVLDALTHTAMDIKGLAGPGGYPDADAFAVSLIALLTSAGNLAPKNVELVEAHVDAIRATREKAYSAKVAAALAAELSARTAELVGDTA